MFNYIPIPEEELNISSHYFAEGEGSFELYDITEGTSKTGLPLLILMFKIWDVTGKNGTIKEYITSNNTWRLHHFLEAIGCADDYQHGCVEARNYIGHCGRILIKYKLDKENKEQRIITFIKGEAKKSFVPMTNSFSNDDVPF